MIEVVHTKGRLYKSPRPGYPGGSHGPYVSKKCVEDTIRRWKKRGITHVVCLLPDAEQIHYYGKRLTRWYRRMALHVIEFPITDFEAPRSEQILPVVRKVAGLLSDERNRLLVHCSAGQGRTGMVVSCIALFMRKHGPFKDVPEYSPQTDSQVRAVNDVRRALGLEDKSARIVQRTDYSSGGDLSLLNLRKNHWRNEPIRVPAPSETRSTGTSSGGRDLPDGGELRVRVPNSRKPRDGGGTVAQHGKKDTANSRKGKVDRKDRETRTSGRVSDKGQDGVYGGEGCWSEDGWFEYEESQGDDTIDKCEY